MEETLINLTNLISGLIGGVTAFILKYFYDRFLESGNRVRIDTKLNRKRKEVNALEEIHRRLQDLERDFNRFLHTKQPAENPPFFANYNSLMNYIDTQSAYLESNLLKQIRVHLSKFSENFDTVYLWHMTNEKIYLEKFLEVTKQSIDKGLSPTIKAKKLIIEYQKKSY